MPPKDRCRLDDEGHRPPRRRKPGGDGHREALPRRPADASLDLSLGNDELLPQHGVLRHQRGVGPKQIHDQPAHEPQQVEHPALVV